MNFNYQFQESKASIRCTGLVFYRFEMKLRVAVQLVAQTHRQLDDLQLNLPLNSLPMMKPMESTTKRYFVLVHLIERDFAYGRNFGCRLYDFCLR